MSDAKPVVVVTGCSKGGIGFALYVHAVSCLPRPLASSHVHNRGSADAFATKGCIVYATARRIDAMEGLEHDNVRMLALDVTKDQNVKEVVQSIVAAEGHIDVLVNNAGKSAFFSSL